MVSDASIPSAACAGSPGDALSPDMRRFQQWLSAAYARHPPLDSVDLSTARAIIEQVRAPLTEGGPAMASSEDREVNTGRHAPLRLRIHRPSAAPRLPALLYLHGGGWVYFSNRTHDRLMREYAARSGRLVIGLDYAQAPEARYPVALNQCVDTVHWLRACAPALGLDPGHLALGGDSAGANLALATALALREQGARDGLDALVLNYGAFTDEETESHTLYDGPRYVLGREEMRWFWAQYLGRPQDRLDPLAQPGRADLRDLPPCCVVAAECDVLRDNSLALDRSLDRAGVAHALHRFAGASHSFLEALNFSPLALQALQAGADWLHRHGPAERTA